MIPNVLSIAGSDPSGGAGIQADLKTFAALRCHGLTVITALTAQNTQGVSGLFAVSADFVAAQLEALFADCDIDAVKIGMTASADVIAIIAARLARYPATPIVLDPVLAASSGDKLSFGEIAESLILHLAPRVTLVTPNLAEAAELTRMSVPESMADVEQVARRLHALGFAAVLLKGGHRAGPLCDDVLYDGTSFQVFSAPRVATRHTHGTGCTLSAAIAANLAQGYALGAAIEAAKAYLQRALETADRLHVGHGPGPLNHFHRFWD